MLKRRILTALILAPLTLWAVLALPTGGFALLVGGVVALGAWEWTRLLGLDALSARLAYTAVVGGIMAGLYPLIATSGGVVAVGALALAWWLAALGAVLRYPHGTEFWRTWPGARALAGLFVLVPAWACLVLLQREPGPGYVVLLMVLIWGADTGAYFAGRRWGRHKLAPRVSPGKSWEGAGGGAALALGAAAAGWLWLRPESGLLLFGLVCLVTVAASVLGDLAESMFKRMTNVKDSGGLLPGHGGVLDRIDSLTAAAPVFALGLYGLGVMP